MERLMWSDYRFIKDVDLNQSYKSLMINSPNVMEKTI